uniref:Uncharacterized protein n=1 Tax=uncultured prokaryote TaxID=198431 RepID=A0A0H5QMD0_9ZZZZ|nr:hypothetical protein [uncultured prokaryote]
MSRKAGAKRYSTRPSYDDLGLSPERLQEIESRCRSGAFDRETMQRACGGFEWITEYIILSATKNVSFDRLEFNTKWGRISCGRSDFYSYRRQFYRNLSNELDRNTGGAAVHGI